MDAGNIIRRKVKEMERELQLIDILREITKTEGGRLTDFGRELLQVAREHEVQQAFMAKLLDISSGAVSQHYNR